MKFPEIFFKEKFKKYKMLPRWFLKSLIFENICRALQAQGSAEESDEEAIKRRIREEIQMEKIFQKK